MLVFKKHNNYYLAISESGNKYRIIKDEFTKLWDVQKLYGLMWENYGRFSEYETLKEAKEFIANSFNDECDRKMGYFN